MHFSQGTKPMRSKKVAAEPVRTDQVGSQKNLGHGLVNALRQLWLSLQTDLIRKSWRPCELEPRR